MFILKHFKIMKNSKVARWKENGSQILLKNGFLEPKRKKTKDEKLKRWNYLKKIEFEKLFAN